MYIKKFITFVMCLSCISLTAFSQGFYLDLGIGFGPAWTKIDGDNVSDVLSKDNAAKINEISADMSLKAGYGPLPQIPLYVVGELAGMGHRFYANDNAKSNYIEFDSYIIGPGILLYPIKLIQLGSSIGYSIGVRKSDNLGEKYDHKNKGGFAWNVSAALDIGSANHACLLGVKYFNAYNTLETTNAKKHTSMVTFFVKYAYRTKITISGT